MTEAELRRRVETAETDAVEFTSTTRDRDKFCETVCAFANDLANRGKPGLLVIGVDNDGMPCGIKLDDAFMAGLGAIRSDGNILPLPSISIQKVETSAGDVAVVEVQPSQQPPVRYRGRVYVRIGPRRGIATEQEERALSERRVSRSLTFDAQTCHEAALSDLNLGLFLNDYRVVALAPEIIEENHRDVKEQLASLRFFDLQADRPTHAGVLLFAKDPTYFLPGAYVQFLRVNGSSLADEVVNERLMKGDLISLLRNLDAIIDAHRLQYPIPLTTLRERIVESFPAVAVRELTLNAIMHRDYQSTAPLRVTWYNDRIEIQSPGGLYAEASPENFPRQTSYRNPVVAEALRNLGYVNRYGRGVIRSQEALRENGSPPAEFEFDRGFFLAVLRKHPDSPTLSGRA
ncbi:MAG: hypothetical protein AMXMBFR81_00110 [Chthonomonas sp.]